MFEEYLHMFKGVSLDMSPLGMIDEEMDNQPRWK